MGNHNIFIAECKYWSGAKGLGNTLDQLFRYVTWRDTKTSIIKFVDRKSFTPIVEEATKTMGAHPLLVRQPNALMRHDVVNHVRRRDDPTLQTELAQRLLYQLELAQPSLATRYRSATTIPPMAAAVSERRERK